MSTSAILASDVCDDFSGGLVNLTGTPFRIFTLPKALLLRAFLKLKEYGRGKNFNGNRQPSCCRDWCWQPLTLVVPGATYRKRCYHEFIQDFQWDLDAAGVFANEGKMVDASFVEATRQCNSREEKKHIKETVINEKGYRNLSLYSIKNSACSRSERSRTNGIGMSDQLTILWDNFY